jgi:hypothetical protein
MEMSAVTNATKKALSSGPDRESPPDRDRLVPATDRKCLDGQSVAQLDVPDSSRSRGFGRYEI